MQPYLARVRYNVQRTNERGLSVNAGEVVTVLHSSNDWMFCRYGSEEGYIPARLLTRIQEDDLEASTEGDKAYVNSYSSDVHQDLIARIRNPQLKHASSQPRQPEKVDTGGAGSELFSMLKQMRQRTDDYVITDNTVPRREEKSPEKETPVKRFPNPVTYTPSPKPFTSTPVSMDYGEKFARPSRPGMVAQHVQPAKTAQSASKPLPDPPSKVSPLPDPSLNRSSSRFSMMTPMPEYKPAVTDRLSLEPRLLERRGSTDSFEQESPVMTPKQPNVSQSVQQPLSVTPPIQQPVPLANARQQSVQQHVRLPPIQQSVQQHVRLPSAHQQRIQQPVQPKVQQPIQQPVQPVQPIVQQPIQQPVQQPTQPFSQPQYMQQCSQQPQLHPEVSMAVVLHDFKYPSEKCITSKKGEQLLIYLTKSPAEWYFAKNSLGEYGIIPRTYCKLLP